MENLSNYLKENMKKSDIYTKLKAENPNSSGVLKIGAIYQNPAEETSNRKSCTGDSWIQYWKEMTDHSENHLECSFCGKTIFIDIDFPDALTYRMKNIKCGKEKHQAFGGHYKNNYMNNSVYKYIIIPVCCDCNSQCINTELKVKISNKYVFEIDPQVDEE